jgi:hypothetical protein
MNENQLQALRHVAANEVLFHRGTWGGPQGYRWRGPDGAEAGLVPQWESDALDTLASRSLIKAERRRGPLDRGVTITPTGAAALGTLREAA